MTYSIHISKKSAVAFVAIMAMVIAAGLLQSQRSHGQSTGANRPPASSADPDPGSSQPTIELSASQLSAVKIEPVETYSFPVENEAVGSSGGNLGSANLAPISFKPSQPLSALRQLLTLLAKNCYEPRILTAQTGFPPGN